MCEPRKEEFLFLSISMDFIKLKLPCRSDFSSFLLCDWQLYSPCSGENKTKICQEMLGLIWPWFGQTRAWHDFQDLSFVPTWEWLRTTYWPEWDCLCLATADVSISYRPRDITPHPSSSHTTPYIISPHQKPLPPSSNLYKQDWYNKSSSCFDRLQTQVCLFWATTFTCFSPGETQLDQVLSSHPRPDSRELAHSHLCFLLWASTVKYPWVNVSELSILIISRELWTSDVLKNRGRWTFSAMLRFLLSGSSSWRREVI